MDASSLTFEQAMARLGEIVRRMEDGGLPLQESLDLFEEGERLGRRCLKLLDEAELRIQVVHEGKNGAAEISAFDPTEPAF